MDMSEMRRLIAICDVDKKAAATKFIKKINKYQFLFRISLLCNILLLILIITVIIVF